LFLNEIIYNLFLLDINFLKMNKKDEEKDEFNKLIAMFWPIWAPLTIGVIYLFFRSMY